MGWNKVAVKDMSNMFNGAAAFGTSKGDIKNWNTGAVTTMASMFEDAKAFNKDINNWDTTKVTNMASMFKGALLFNQDIKNWIVTAVTANGGTTTTWMFTATNTDSGGSFATAKEPCFGGVVSTTALKWRGCSFASNSDLQTAENNCLSAVNTGVNCCTGGASVCGAAGTAEMPDWDVSLVTSMKDLFKDKADFNVDISSWNTAAVTDMDGMFSGAAKFDEDIKTNGNAWKTNSVSKMSNMFKGAAAFGTSKGDIKDWNTALVTTMASMFRGAEEFDFSIKTNGNAWKTAAVTDMSSMFEDAKKFDKNINNWDTTKVIGMSNMFKGALLFNQDIKKGSGNEWKTVKVQNMANMFKDAQKFNQDISNWDITAVTANGGTTSNWMFTRTNTDSGGSFATDKEPCASSAVSTTALKWRKC